MGGIYEYVVEMCSGAMINIPSFINIDSSIQKLIGGGGFKDTDNMEIIHKPTFSFPK
jgi:hypothetical protein